jgi:hypothetical protein
MALYESEAEREIRIAEAQFLAARAAIFCARYSLPELIELAHQLDQLEESKR